MESNDREYKNDDITIYWKPAECIHATLCYKELIDVFNPSKRPWVNMNGAPSEKIIDIVKRCPTDALTYTNNDGSPSDKAPGKDSNFAPNKRESGKLTEIEVIKGGPLLVEGDFKITGPDGNEMSRSKMAYFCRCGNSKRMPFCDGSHRKANFEK